MRLLLILVTVTAAEVIIEPKDLGEFRVGQYRSLLIQHNEVPLTSVNCSKLSVCYVTSFKATNGSINVTIYGNFLGITDLVAESHMSSFVLPITIRVMRAQVYVILAEIFTYVAGTFVVTVTFMMGTQLEWARIKKVLKRPFGPAIGFCCQFLFMPVTGYILARYGFSDEDMVLRMALFVASTCPGGGKSSFWTIIYGGNLDLSVAMTFTQTISALFMMPLWMYTLGTEFTSKRINIPFISIVEGLAALLIPSALGMFFIQKRPDLIKTIEKWIKRASWVATILFTVFGLYANWYVILLLTWRTVLIGCALPWSGYIIALITAKICGQDFRDTITIAIETGVQNIGIATIIMMWSLPEPEVDISLTVLFAIILSTDKPLIIIYLARKFYKRCLLRQTDEIADSEKQPRADVYKLQYGSEEINKASVNDSRTLTHNI